MKRKVFVAIPTMGNVSDAQVSVMRKLQAAYADRVELVYPKDCVRRMFHDYARNALVEEFLASDAEALWFLDSDIAPCDTVLDLVTEHWDKWQVAGAPYPIFICPEEGSKPQVVMAVFDGSNGKGLCPSKVPYSGTAYVDGLATGCLFIKRELINQLKKPYFEFTFDGESRKIEEGEDLGFCRKVNALGHKFFVDYSMTCKHYKSVCLLDVNNYAIDYANRAVLNYDAAIRPQIQELAQRLTQRKSRPSLGAGPQGTTDQMIVTPPAPSIILPGHGSPFARGNGR